MATKENDDGIIETTEEEVETNEESTETEENGNEGAEESIEELKARLAKAEEIAKNQRIRAEKAESKAKDGAVAPKPTKAAEKQDLSTKDLYALMEAKVPQDDVDEVAEYARFAKLSIGDALKSNVVQTILKDKAEMRATADATNTGGARRVSAKVSGETLLSKAAKGELPDSDEDLQRLVAARMPRPTK